MSVGCVGYETVEAIIPARDPLSISRSTVSVAMIIYLAA